MEDSPLYSSNNPGSLTLGQRLQRRLVEPAGVINTQQLHCHYQATHGTAGRLIQRLALPEQVKFRYGSGVLQPTAIIQRLQRQRTESANDFDRQFQGAPVPGETVQRFVQPQSRQFQNNRKIEGRNPNRLGKSHTNPLQPPITQEATVMTKPLVKATDQNHLKTPASLLEKKTKSQISNPLVKTSRETGEKRNRGETQQQLRIDRKATVSEVNALSSNESHSGQRQVDTHFHANPTVTQTQLETSGALSPPSSEKSGTFRISRKATIAAANASNPGARGEGESKSPKSQDLPLAQATSQLSASTAQTKADDSDAVIQAKIQENKSPSEMIESQEAVNLTQISNPRIRVQAKSSQQPNQDLPLAQATSQLSASTAQTKADDSDAVIQAKIQENKSPSEMIESQEAVNLTQISNPRIRVQAKSSQQPNQDLPLAQATSQLSVSTAQTKAGASVQPKTNPPVIKGIIQTKAAAMKSQSTVSTRSIVPVRPHSKSLPLSLQGQKANLPIQLSQEASVASKPTVVSTKPIQLSSSSELKMVWLKSINDLQTSEGLSTTTQYSQKMLLPLAISQISTNGVLAKRLPFGQIARQTNAVDNSTVQPAMSGNSLTQMSSPETASVSPMDLTQVAEQVSRILTRQLSVERERRGIARW